MTAPLFSPFQLRSIEFRNRIGVSPMCQYSSQDGFAMTGTWCTWVAARREVLGW